MSLIKCSECGQEVSEKAGNCPHCGNPVAGKSTQIVNGSQNFKVELELTNKKWKKVILIAWGIIFGGAMLGAILQNENMILGMIFLGILVLIYGKIGAWYSNR